MPIDTDLRIPLVEPPFDPEELAAFFEAGFPLEFCACPSFESSLVAGLVRAGFIPMATEWLPDRDLLLPKLHLERCLLDPARVRITRTARRESRGFSLDTGRDLPAVIAACVASHGDGWLRPDLVRSLLDLATAPGRYGTRIVSFELRERDRLVAGEFGALVGSCYTSWSGFRLDDAEGSGTVQLVALARALERSGVELWDLGMPLPYKSGLGAETVDRREFLARFRVARHGTPSGFGFLPGEARGLVDREGWPSTSDSKERTG
jgi:Leu/Phe-tRNA-protein transferase